MNEVKLSIPPSPALGGILLACAEGKLRYGTWNLEVHLTLDKITEERRKLINSFETGIEGLGNVSIKFGVDASTASDKKNYDSPSFLTEFGDSNSIRSSLVFSQSIQKLTLNKLNLKPDQKYLVVHANLFRVDRATKEDRLLSRGDAHSFAWAINKYTRIKRRSLVLIGDDGINLKSSKNRYVKECYKEGIDIVEQLSLISSAAGFLGMSSGPSAAALLSNTPYVIFKHKKHHALQMEADLAGEKKYPFANRDQIYIRKYPSRLLILWWLLRLGSKC